MKEGGDKQIKEALRLLRNRKGDRRMMMTIVEDFGDCLSWMHRNYDEVLARLMEAMVALGYEEGKEAKYVADAYLSGYIRGLLDGQLLGEERGGIDKGFLSGIKTKLISRKRAERMATNFIIRQLLVLENAEVSRQ